MVGHEGELNLDVVAREADLLELPKAVAGNAVGGMFVWGSGMGIEPRPAERDAASNGLSFLVDGVGGGVENALLRVLGLPVDEVGAMEGEGRRAGGSFDLKGGIVGCEFSEGDSFGEGDLGEVREGLRRRLHRIIGCRNGIERTR